MKSTGVRGRRWRVGDNVVSKSERSQNGKDFTQYDTCWGSVTRTIRETDFTGRVYRLNRKQLYVKFSVKELLIKDQGGSF